LLKNVEIQGMENGVFKNRIVGHGVKPASQFMANPLNWRQHPPEQRNLLNSVLNEIGWVQNVVENVTTGHLLDGHERVWQGLQNGDADVPYVQVELSPDEEKTMLALLDPISEMAYTDKDNLKSLLEGVTAMDVNITKFLSEMAEKEGIIPSDFDPIKEWQGMPEFEQNTVDAFQTIIIRFKEEKDIVDFSNLIKQNITPQTKSLWFPKQDWDQLGRNKIYES